MRDVNSLVKIPELNRDMRQFSIELTKVPPTMNLGVDYVGWNYWRNDG